MSQNSLYLEIQASEPPHPDPATPPNDLATRSQTPDRPHSGVNPGWLVNLRWVAVLGQLTTIGVVLQGLGIELQRGPLLAIVLFTAATNIVLALWLYLQGSSKSGPGVTGWDERVLGSIMLLDLCLLTALLYFAGGPSNPFHIFYLVNLALSAVLLAPRWAWTLTAFALVCGSGLTLHHHLLPFTAQSGWLTPGGGETILRMGQLVALSASAIVIVYFVTRLTGEQRRMQAELRIADQRQARTEKLEALATLAAGAAHELASPLSIIAVIVKELQRRLQNVAESDVTDDLQVMREEVDRCRAILNLMAADAGQSVGEEVALFSGRVLVDEILAGLRQAQRVQVEFLNRADTVCFAAPRRGLAQALRGVVKNSLDASDPDGLVELRVAAPPGWLEVEISDSGSGMTPEVLARAGEPFFTTKGPGTGMGLGLFLARSVVDRLGGTLQLSTRPPRGVTARVRLPRRTE